jgi:drug/metabolite transporter (DMT)-like permease
MILFIKERSGFKISIKDLPLFLGLGLCSILFFTICYFTAIKIMTISMAAILLYTSPIWVMLMSIIFFKEKITKYKLIALILSFTGCVLVSGIGNGNVKLIGILIGLGAGIGYGLYSILGTIALKKYSPYTVTTYTFIIAGFGSIPLCSPLDTIHKISNTGNIFYFIIFVIITSLVTAVIPFMCYTLGLRSVNASKAAIAATVEPMVATLIGAVIFKEALTYTAAFGILCILISIFVLNQTK